MLRREGNNAEASRRARGYDVGVITPHVGQRIATDDAPGDMRPLRFKKVREV